MHERPFVKHILLRTAQEFIDYLRLSNPEWGEGLDTPWIFRGHADADWDLMPRSRRPDGRRLLKPLFSQALARRKDWNVERYEVALSNPSLIQNDEVTRNLIRSIQTEVEGNALAEFAQLADQLSLRIDDVQDWQRAGSVIPSHAAALAQHHGVPMPMLDWSRNPLVAAFFAVEENPSASHLAVWALNAPAACSPPDLVSRKSLHTFQCPRSSHAYLHAQDGLFTWASDHREWNYLLAHGHWPSHLDLIESDCKPEPPPVCMRKILLPRTEAPRLRNLLWRERISRAHLMPTFDNVSAALLVKWRDQ